MKKKLLIIEDEVSIIKILKDKFIEENFEVFEAHDGIEGLESAFKNHPNLIILDIIMPKMDGFAMLEKLRKDKWGKTVPVIVLSNLAEVSAISKAFTNNILEYFIKTDWKLDELTKIIKKKMNLL